jgi:hypothetical protein
VDLYIYYRVANEHAPRLRQMVQCMQQSLAGVYGIVCALKRRPGDKDGKQTWMEVYAAVPGDFEARLERTVGEAGLSAMIDGPRHTEHFLDMP